MRPQNVVNAAGTSALILAASAVASDVEFKVRVRAADGIHISTRKGRRP
jgi:hypothetical protein